MLRSAIKLLIVIAAIGGPILYYKAPNIWNSAKETCSNFFSGSEAEKAKTPDVDIDTPPEITPLGTPKVPVHEGVVTDFAEVFRFDVSSDWIMNRWPRVSTGLSQPRFQGYRVPLVTGTRLDDVAGSLTYYFNPYQQVQTITFNGTTGDATRLIQMMSQKYGFQRQLTKDGGLFVYIVPNEKEKVQSMMRIRPAGIIRADAPHSRFQVDIILQRPNNEKVANKQSVPNWQK
ncbi:MAG: hypothetical protein PVH19_00460 [Planctomycetia bacterium]|jgi:hypothetical protein